MEKIIFDTTNIKAVYEKLTGTTVELPTWFFHEKWDDYEAICRKEGGIILNGKLIPFGTPIIGKAYLGNNQLANNRDGLIGEILYTKSLGQDCTEEESGHIKQLLKEIMERFPNEFSEACTEQEDPELRIMFLSGDIHWQRK